MKQFIILALLLTSYAHAQKLQYLIKGKPKLQVYFGHTTVVETMEPVTPGDIVDYLLPKNLEPDTRIEILRWEPGKLSNEAKETFCLEWTGKAWYFDGKKTKNRRKVFARIVSELKPY